MIPGDSAQGIVSEHYFLCRNMSQLENYSKDCINLKSTPFNITEQGQDAAHPTIARFRRHLALHKTDKSGRFLAPSFFVLWL